MKTFNLKERAILNYLYNINRYAPAYEISKGAKISLPTAQKYCQGSLKKYLITRPLIIKIKTSDGKGGIRRIIEYKFRTKILQEIRAKSKDKNV